MDTLNTESLSDSSNDPFGVLDYPKSQNVGLKTTQYLDISDDDFNIPVSQKQMHE